MTNVLKLGSKGPEVKKLQELLNKILKPVPKLAVDGDFGPSTDAATKKLQAQLNIGIDGIVGPKTRLSMEAKLAGKTVVKPPEVISISTDWMKIAQKEIGQKEISGSNANPKIIQYHATTTLKATSDETAWCSSFVNWVLKEANIVGTKSAAAASWVTWGDASTAKSGAITVIRNASVANSSLTATGNHVGLLVKETATHYMLLGGNQSDQVKISSFPKSSWTLRGYRWPKSAKLGA